MKESPSRYGGIAAALVFGLGLLIVGFSLPAEHHTQAVTARCAGAVVLLFGLGMLAVTVSQTQASKAVFAALMAVVLCGLFAYQAATNELTGTAIYHHSWGKGGRQEAVTRDSSPVKFRSATNLLWGVSALCFGISLFSFKFYRELEE